MESVSHRQLRNDSAAVLRRVAAGESLVVTNHGRPAAVISPVRDDVLSVLAANGELRAATRDPATLLGIERVAASTTTAELIADSRGAW